MIPKFIKAVKISWQPVVYGDGGANHCVFSPPYEELRFYISELFRLDGRRIGQIYLFHVSLKKWQRLNPIVSERLRYENNSSSGNPARDN